MTDARQAVREMLESICQEERLAIATLNKQLKLFTELQKYDCDFIAVIKRGGQKWKVGHGPNPAKAIENARDGMPGRNSDTYEVYAVFPATEETAAAPASMSIPPDILPEKKALIGFKIPFLIYAEDIE